MENKKLIILTLCLFALGTSFAQQEKGIIGEDNWLNFWTQFKIKPDINPKPTQILSAAIKGGDTVVLQKREIYLLLGDVFVSDSTTLVIEPGTLILADHKTKASLIIASGSKLIAQGTQTDPIVFTSSNNSPSPGDWGGIFLLGDAPTNKISEKNILRKGFISTKTENLIYGGTNAMSDSGVLEYVRIQYAGKRTKEFGFFDSLGLYAVGNETRISNVMISQSKGNSLYVLGGEVELSQMVSFKASRSDFVFDFGTQATISNSLAVRSPYSSASIGSASIVATSQSDKDLASVEKAQTSIKASNLTLLNSSENLKSAIEVGLVHEALYIDANTSFKMDSSVLSGFNPAVVFSSDIFLNNENLQRIKFTKMYFNSCEGNIFIENSPNNEDLENWYGNGSFQNVYSKGEDDKTFIDPHNVRNPDFRLRINKIIATSSNN